MSSSFADRARSLLLQLDHEIEQARTALAQLEAARHVDLPALHANVAAAAAAVTSILDLVAEISPARGSSTPSWETRAQLEAELQALGDELAAASLAQLRSRLRALGEHLHAGEIVYKSDVMREAYEKLRSRAAEQLLERADSTVLNPLPGPESPADWLA